MTGAKAFDIEGTRPMGGKCCELRVREIRDCEGEIHVGRNGGGDVLVVASGLFSLTVMDCGGACREEMMACSPVARILLQMELPVCETGQK